MQQGFGNEAINMFVHDTALSTVGLVSFALKKKSTNEVTMQVDLVAPWQVTDSGLGGCIVSQAIPTSAK